MAGKRKSKTRGEERHPLEAIAPGPCSFCGRTPLEHEGLQFQKGNYRICAECVTRMHKDLKQDGKS